MSDDHHPDHGEDTPVVNFLRETFEGYTVGYSNIQTWAVYASFVGLGIVFGAMFTGRMVFGSADPAGISTMGESVDEYVLSVGELGEAVQYVMAAGIGIFLACHAVVLAIEFVAGGEE